jgi:hypothetical protein
MSFLSGLKVFGTDIEKAFAWFGSSNGKAVVAAGEAVVEAVAPASTPLVNIFNAWAAKAFNVESLAVAAGQNTGTGPQKAALVMAAVAPDILQYAQEAGVSARTAAQIATANTALIAFIDAMTSPTAA